MKDTLHFFVTSIVEHTDSVSIEERKDGDATILIIHVAPEDIGQVIGKSGRIIKALRDLMKVIAAKQNTFVDVEVAEETQAA
jgi:predicted RNA-binding protein YlqC (UPF0109 family)